MNEVEVDIPLSTFSTMVYEKNRLDTFPPHQWPYMEDCGCTPDKVKSLKNKVLKFNCEQKYDIFYL